jgi:NAD(P)-dependent dehydrogenase (short-subunit alcohol dehydrogenase family)
LVSAARLGGTVALITGGTSGIGLSVARRLREEGAAVVITGRDPERGSAAEAELGGDALFVAAEVAEEAAAERSRDAALERFGRLDILVNNAGVALTERLIDTPPELFDRLMAVNLRGPFLYARCCFEALAATRGVIVNIGSDAGLRGEQAIGAYSVAKAALVMLSNMLALDGAAAGVRSNCVCPGATAPGMRHIGPAADPERGDDSDAWPPAPLGRIGNGADVAAAVAYLAGPEAAFVTGAVLSVDGGGGAGLLA